MGGPGPDPDPGNPRPPDAIYRPRYDIAVVEITEDCNLRCLHCYNRQRSPRNLSLAEGRRMARILQSLGMKYVIFSGGEPSVHPLFFDLVDIFNGYGLPIIMRSNGQLMDAAMVIRIAARRFHFVGISIDGGTRETNDAIRGEGAWDRAIRAVRLLKDRGLRVTIEVTLTRTSVKEIEEIVRNAEDVAVDLVIFRRFIPLGGGAGNPKLCAPNEAVLKAREAIRAFSETSPVQLEVGCNLGAVCLAYDYVAIDLDGWVHPCYMLRKPLFHISEWEGGSRARLQSFQGQNRHECLNFLQINRTPDHMGTWASASSVQLSSSE